jgi:hypothetical protein
MTGAVFCVAGTFRLAVPRGVAADDNGIDMARDWRPSDDSPSDLVQKIIVLMGLHAEPSEGRDENAELVKRKVGAGA